MSYIIILRPILLAIALTLISACGASTPVYTANGPVRTLEEMQYGFDRAKRNIQDAFVSHLSRHPPIRGGRIVVSLTISPQGLITDCRGVSSTFSDSGLEHALLAEVWKVTFGARDIPEFVYANYPINFLPH